MEQKDVIVNRVSNSGLVSLDLEDFLDKRERVIFDVKDNLYQGLILKEKDFRAFIKQHDWEQYKDKNVGLTCSVDAIVPTWAYMLLTSKLAPYANLVAFGDENALEEALVNQVLNQVDFSEFEGAKVVIKGCADLKAPEYMFVETTRRLRPYAASIMYGEPCSTVPIYKKPRQLK
ncbi:DUF2480 family protein [Fulvivirgaceae bacterium BMA12]|uniref:DUF2480 family protein n=1 Tax=Agaribacillus aureus TaxID=3051825 RepID=A0ABT8LIA0_9BACT|nr:DUF2480 family protein [Fulvivirgaceae bacterium BMA12]